MFETGERHVEAVRRVLGRIDLDPCSDAPTNEVVQAKRFFTDTFFRETAQRSWRGVTCGCPQRVFLHPPEPGRTTERFVNKLFEQIDEGNVLAAITLLDAERTHMPWFQRLLDLPLCFTDHDVDTPIFCGSLFVYYGARPNVFQREFQHLGPVLHRATKMPLSLVSA